MAQEYREQVNASYEGSIKNRINEFPPYIKDFFLYLGTKIRPSTQWNYLLDIEEFLFYQRSNFSKYANTDISKIPLKLLSNVTPKDIDEYMSYLQKAGNSAGTIKRKLAALSRLYKYLNRDGHISENPLASVDRPRVDRHDIIWLSSDETNRLLRGILKNDKMLIMKKVRILNRSTKKEEICTRPVVTDISPLAKTRRELLVSRNYAIAMLFLGTGMRISELVGIDLNDVNMADGRINIIRKRGKHEHIFFGDEVKQALSLYLYGPHDKVNPPKSPNDKDVAAFCDAYKTDPEIKRRASAYFSTKDDDFLSGVEEYAAYLRMRGRSCLNPSPAERALFISNRGKRITPRMVELMIKEMVFCYLPDCENKEHISPHKLRSTCATRLLAQTGDIMAVSEQLGHDSITTTSKHYAQLQRDRSLRATAALSVTKW